MKVWHDPGHGGDNTGTTAGGIVEKDLVLNIAADITAALWGWGVEQQASRLQDEDFSLHARGQRAEAWGADLALIYHINALPSSPKTSGLITFCEESGRDVAAQIMRSAPAPLLRSRPLPAMPGGRLWTRNAGNCLVPYRGLPAAVLIEFGFATNEADVTTLTGAVDRPGIVAAVLTGVACAMRAHSHG